MQIVRKRKMAVIDQKNCVACGCCMKVCPMNAIHIEKGIFAAVDGALCVGCGKCTKECPASVIRISEAVL